MQHSFVILNGQRKELDMSKYEQEQHYKLWDWLAETGIEYKADWPGWKDEKYFYYHGTHCFACGKDLFLTLSSNQAKCRTCPIDWKVDLKSDFEYIGMCGHHDSIYMKWMETKIKADRQKYAALIRDAEWKDRD